MGELDLSVHTDHHVTLQSASLPWRDGTASQATSTSEQVEVGLFIPESLLFLHLFSSYYLQESKCTSIVSLYFGTNDNDYRNLKLQSVTNLWSFGGNYDFPSILNIIYDKSDDFLDF